MKPYFIYNEYGVRMIAHPLMPSLLGLPKKGQWKQEGIRDIVKSLVIWDVDEGKIIQLRKDIVKLILDAWEQEDWPKARIIRNT